MLEKQIGVTTLAMNEIGQIAKTQRPRVFDSYANNRPTGSFVLIDGASHHTVAAGIIIDPQPNSRLSPGSASAF